MRLRTAIRTPAVLVWFGVLGPPFAWTAQHVAGFALTQAECGGAGRARSVPVDELTLAITVAAAALAVLAELASVAVFRATRGAGADPPGARIRFLAVIGISTAPLFLFIILMSGIGSVVLADCHQG